MPASNGGIWASFRDITAAKTSEETVQLYRGLALEAGQIGFWRWERKTGRVSWSPELEAIYGLSTGSFKSTIEAFFELVYRDDRASVNSAVQAAVESGSNFQVEHRFVRADGAIRWVEGRGRVLRDSDGTATGIVGVTWDTTDRRNQEESIRGSEQQLRDVLNGLFALVWVVDVTGNIVTANRTALEVADKRLSEVVGQPFLRYPCWCASASTQNLLSGALERGAGGSTSRFDLRLTGPSAGNFAVDFSVAPLAGSAAAPSLLICSAVVITERKEAEEALRDSQERLRLALTAGQMGIWEIDLKTQAVTASESVDILFGVVPSSSARTLNYYLDQIHQDDQASVKEALTRNATAGVEHSVEFRVQLQSGESRWLASRGEQLGGPESDIHVFSGALSDVTERHRTEEALRDSEERYRRLVELLPQLVWTCLPDGRCDYLSKQWIDYTGVPEEDQLGLAWLRVLHPEDAPYALEIWLNAVENNGDYDLEYRIRGADGNYRWFKTRGVPLRNSAGQIEKWFGTCTDIEEARQAAQSLRERSERLRAALNASSTGTFRWSPDTDRLEADDSLDRLFGWEDTRDTREKLIASVHPEDRETLRSQLERCAREGRDVDVEFRVVWPDGSAHWLAQKAKVAKFGSREAYVTGACVDITDAKRAEEELKATNRALVRINEDLEQFAYAASHDLQEPLRMVTSYSQLLARRYADQLDAQAKEFIDFAVQGAQQMESLIKGVLQFTRITYEDEISNTVVDSQEVLNSAIHNLSSSIAESSAQVEVRGTLPKVYLPDVQLLQVFQNLIGNAIKYRGKEPPLIVVEAKQLETEWLFTVTDNGRGFSQIYAERIFGMFKRLQKAGTGIGLAICRRIIERHGGRIWAESQEGTGAQFFFTVPLAPNRVGDAGYPMQ